MTETDHKPYTDADVETAVKAMWRVGAPCDGSFTRAEVARIVLDALTAAGWRPPTGTVGRCGHQMPGPILAYGRTDPISCRLPAEHAGWHRSGVTEWGRRESAAQQMIADLTRDRDALKARNAILALTIASVTEALSIAAEQQAEPTGPDWSHEIAFDTDGAWSIGHPDGCPGRAFGDCDVYRAAAEQLIRANLGTDLAGHRFQCAVNDLGDRFLIGDRIDEPSGCPETVWDGPYSMRCGKGADVGVCSTHGRFRPVEQAGG